MSNKPFGYSYLLDCYDVKEGSADDLELIYRFLEELVDKIGMTKMIPPIVIHAPKKEGVEIYPDKAGVSGWVGLIESGIQIHAIEPTHFISLDVYSCAKFDPKLIIDFAREKFEFKHFEENFINRGIDYNKLV